MSDKKPEVKDDEKALTPGVLSEADVSEVLEALRRQELMHAHRPDWERR